MVFSASQFAAVGTGGIDVFDHLIVEMRNAERRRITVVPCDILSSSSQRCSDIEADRTATSVLVQSAPDEWTVARFTGRQNR